MLHARAIKLTNVMRHDSTEVELPEHGIVVVRGANGAGKSTLLESIPAALWNKTLRGQPWYREKANSEIEVAFKELAVKRTRNKKGKGALDWEGGAKAETVTKAQPGLDALVGSFETWRRTSVFSSHDAASFSIATDGERKRLIETILGLDRFDVALKKCREDLSKSKAGVADLRRKAEVVETKIDADRRAIESFAELVGEAPPVPDVERMSKLTEESTRLMEEISAVRAASKELELDKARAHGETAALRKRYSAVSVDVCPTCAQKIDPKLAEKVATELGTAQGKARLACDKIDEQIKEHDERVERLSTERRAVDDELGKLREINRTRLQWEKGAAKHKQLRGEAEARIKTLSAQAVDLADEIDAAVADVAVLEASETALGLRGVRAFVLDRAVRGIEIVTNAWLGRLFPGVSLRIGGDSDKIELEVDGLDHPYGYYGASGGERRRIDVALLLALAEISSASYGKRPGTLWFDEVFDALDEAGRAAVCEVLSEMAAERAVVVITHSDELARLLPATVRLHVDQGRVTG